ncbi:uncharacterized protein LOC110933996 [Helianthus annuus]|uniref:uncharacterized protein LOC110933996 n=1 Tax=Helianthus annuus TaxID=4232 RepID=UPI000B901D42|nr:uncharacterized protein LOC110933996 [Helianthus annuus]
MLAKWWWRFKIEKDNTWRKVIWSIHKNARSWSFIPAKPTIPGPWKQVVRVEKDIADFCVNLSSFFMATVGNGEEVSFWKEFWHFEGILSTEYPALFALERVKNVKLADRITETGGTVSFQFCWMRVPSTADEISELNRLTVSLSSLSLSNSADSWSWTLEESGVFQYEYEESTDHLFALCSLVHQVWDYVLQWCRIPPTFFFGVKDVLNMHKEMRGSRKWKKAVYTITQTGIWCIWKARNDLTFNGKSANVDRLVEEIKIMSFLWLKNRTKIGALTREKWRVFDISCIGI